MVKIKISILFFSLLLLLITACQPTPKTTEESTAQPVAVEMPTAEVEEIKEVMKTEEVKVVPKVQDPQFPPVTEFTIEGDDAGLYPKEITVKLGDLIKITFAARSKGVYYGGLDFWGEPWGNTGTVKPGQSTTVTFTAEKSFEITSYWPKTKALKAKGKVIVE
ncbi:hypothetical protein J4210_00130 [Candidatus Woesearchaeota archaeon]|nr:hypothetical protein [Candidatus Woesearchaeota archaeon]